ncbi:WhiB family transcriptional regulator [Arthrobacter sp. MSA 4-2]|uniref:WhiB family transcriptional regulator n=1 Tax=Arthrobacter sp. MSA 4-2 TaxID=2794349 RepID=UPI001E5EE483|nr:WhiB family transcriptional regulator [Arthrobacter sp. MSA 4-2]
MGNPERVEDQRNIAAHASARYGSRGVPDDWFIDPADPGAAERYRADTRSSLEDQATAFLAAHEALTGLPEVEQGPSSLLVLPGRSDDAWSAQEPAPGERKAQPEWPGLPPAGGYDDGELGWQSDALCAQTDPEAFFPEKGGSTRDAKKVCGACMVRSECLEYALENDERFGIWGGLSERERRRLRKRAV